jgi:hypothetical protein
VYSREQKGTQNQQEKRVDFLIIALNILDDNSLPA